MSERNFDRPGRLTSRTGGKSSKNQASWLIICFSLWGAGNDRYKTNIMFVGLDGFLNQSENISGLWTILMLIMTSFIFSCTNQTLTTQSVTPFRNYVEWIFIRFDEGSCKEVTKKVHRILIWRKTVAPHYYLAVFSLLSLFHSSPWITWTLHISQ